MLSFLCLIYLLYNLTVQLIKCCTCTSVVVRLTDVWEGERQITACYSISDVASMRQHFIFLTWNYTQRLYSSSSDGSIKLRRIAVIIILLIIIKIRLTWKMENGNVLKMSISAEPSDCQFTDLNSIKPSGKINACHSWATPALSSESFEPEDCVMPVPEK